MNKQYFDYNEKTDFEKLKEFNEVKGLFAELHKTPYGHSYDASGLTKDGRLTVIELKSRNAVLTKENTVSGHNFNDDTVFIEDEKATPLYFEYFVNDAIPLYINFLSDGHILLWNLTRLEKNPKHFVDVNINNKGYNKMQKTYREGLYISDAIVYKPLIIDE